MKLSPKQNEYIRNANARWNLKVGAVRSGKSYVDIAYMIPARIRAVSGLSGLVVILGVSKETIERNVLQPMREIYGPALVGNINSQNKAMVCGEMVYCLGAAKVSQVAKIQGSSIKYCYGDECAKWNKEVWEMLKSRLDKPYSRFDGAFNPEYPSHWLKAFMDTKGLDAYIQHYVIDDNPFLPKEYVDNLKNEYMGTVYYDRYILGLWALAEGLIYPMHKDAIVDDIPDIQGDEITSYCISIDYGTMNAFAMMLWELHKDGVWYNTKRYYYSGRDTGVQKTDDEYLADIEKVLDYEVKIHRACGRKIETIIDPSAASFITLLKKKADWSKVHSADNDVANGIRETASAMKNGKIKILKSNVEWIKEAEGYAWDEQSGEDKPIKVNDHLMDATRYFVKTKRITKIKRIPDGSLMFL